MSGLVLITGAAGQVGRELVRTAPPGSTAVAVTRSELDVTDVAAIARIIAQHRPETIVNCAAYTAVDAAESAPLAAASVNAVAAGNLAMAAARVGARMIHLSTDFVFSGPAARPCRITDLPAPISVYGRTKLDGEVAVLKALGDRALVVRTAWLYASHGSNFVKTMLRLMRERDQVRVVADQIGTPTWARALAETLWIAVARPDVSGLLHATDAGVASWYDFAVAIQEEALRLGVLDRVTPVHSITTAEYPTPAQRPSYSVLDTSETVRQLGVVPDHWRTNLRLMLQELTHA